MDDDENETEENYLKLRKYPESVLNFAEYMRNTESTDTTSCSSQDHTDVDRSSSASSDLPTPIYTRSPISCKHHSCGSLFAKCSAQGKWELLQTFSNRESPLSQKTFANSLSSCQSKSKKYQEKIENNETLFHVASFNSKQLNFNFNLKKKSLNSGEQLTGILCRKKGMKSKNRVSFSDDKERNAKNNIPLSISKEETVIRRHHSMLDRRASTNGKTFTEPNEMFNNTSIGFNRNLQLFYGGEKIYKEHANKIEQAEKLSLCDEGEEEHRNLLQQTETFSMCEPLQHCSVQCKRTFHMHASHRRFIKDQKDMEKENFVHEGNNVIRNSFRKSEDMSALALNQTTNVRSAMTRLKNESSELKQEIDYMETEILLLRRELKKKDQENIKLQHEIHKLKSVLQETSSFRSEGDLLSSLHDSYEMPGQIQQFVKIPNPNKKQGVSGESSNHGRNHDQIEIQRFEKDFRESALKEEPSEQNQNSEVRSGRSKQLIKDAIMENNFLKNLDSSQMREIVESVYPKQFSKDDYVVREGEAGSHLYVSAEGELEVIKDDKILGRMGPGKAFGELAILYNCRRTASIKVVTDAKVWVLDRQSFQNIMMKTGLLRLQENVNFLRSVPLLQLLSDEVLAKIADVLEVEFYPSGEHIVRQGATGDTFFIISSGSVKVTQAKPGSEKEEEIRILSKGDYFGEQALLKEDWRTANVIALSPGVECLTLDREPFIQLIGDLSELKEKDYGDQVRGFTRPSSASSLSNEQEYDYIRLQDLEIIGTLGVGGFGRVELVQYSKNRCMTFALKCLKKQHIVETKQQEHVYSERNIMMACNSMFICRLYRTFRDSKYVYMLQEALLGGEVWTILREKGCFDDYSTKFVTGCVIEAFEYLHTRGIIYRDLKPENLLLDSKGYIKLVDFGFSKRIGFSSKTWTFCGTPEYLAPEIILNRGHDRAVDYWSLGILMHELLTGIPPFTAPDPMRTYNFILKGIDMIDFPKHIIKAAQSLIKRLCKDAPSERLGYQRGGIQDIKKHKWFQGFDWAGLKQRDLIPPISPSVISPVDTSNFDYYSKEGVTPPDEFSNWDCEF